MRSCCCELTVDLTWDEVRRIEAHLPRIREVMEGAEQAPGLEVLDEGRFYEVAEGFTPQLAKHRWGCVFAHREQGQAFRCAVHAAALRHGLPVTSVKPNICSMWPLILIEYQTGQYVLSAITDETGPLLEDEERHARYACLRNDQKGPPLYQDFSPLLAEMFGKPFVAALDHAYAVWERTESSAGTPAPRAAHR
jgi:Fe-S-cluster containining protein